MKKLGLVLAAVGALMLGSLTSTQPARADGGATIAVVLVGGWAWCHITYGKKRVLPFCNAHDEWHRAHR
jgi:hypothetical protein